MKFILTLFICLSLFWQSNAQFIVQGKIVNAQTQQPIEFASVLVLDLLEGTMSDTLGNFSLSLDSGQYQIVIQSLGYQADTFIVAKGKNNLLFQLETNDFEIAEVVVYPKNAFEIMRKAVARIDSNYRKEALAQKVFYRQEIMANKQLLNLEEARFDALNTFERKANMVSINKARGILDMDTIKGLGKIVTQAIDFDSMDIKANANYFFFIDVLKSKNAQENKSILGKKGERHYNYQYNGVLQVDSHTVYHVLFDQKDNIKKSLFKGHFYIDTASLAFVGVEVYLSPKGIQYQNVIPKTYQFLAKILGYSIEIKDFRYNINYQLYQNKWVLHNVENYVKAKVSKRKSLSLDGYLKTSFKVEKNYAKEQFYNKKSIYDKIASNPLDFLQKDFFKSK